MGGSSIDVAGAFPNTTGSTRSLTPAVTFRNGPRKRPFEGSRQVESVNTNNRLSQQQGFYRRRQKGTQVPSATRRFLFFNKRDEDGNIIKTTKPRRARPTVETLDELRSPGVSFPREVGLDNDDDADVRLSLRHMTEDDLKTLVPMCIEEFGTDYQLKQLNAAKRDRQRRSLLPRWIVNPKLIPNAWESFSFELLIYWTLRLKLMQGGNGGLRRRSSIPNPSPHDPVMLVLCEQAKRLSDDASRVVGMVELSLQPPDADRNPPALPLPLWVKAALARHTTMDGSLQGWVTNLLIGESCRGKGYSKILMAATEGIAQKWGCSSIYLHADADAISGRVPQRLYEGLGYEVVIGSTRKGSGDNSGVDGKDDGFSPQWAGGSRREQARFMAIRVVDEVCLLCYRKRIGIF